MVIGLRRALFDHLTGSRCGTSRSRSGLDHRAADERRGRGERRALTGNADARLQRRAAACGDRGAADRRLALGLVVFAVLRRRSHSRAGSSARRTSRSSRTATIGVVTAQIAESSPHGDRAGVQPRAPLPGAVRRAERGEPRAATYVQKIFSVFFPSIEFSRDCDAGVLYTGEKLLAHHADDRHADHALYLLSSSFSRCRSSRTSTASSSRAPAM